MNKGKSPITDSRLIIHHSHKMRLNAYALVINIILWSLCNVESLEDVVLECASSRILTRIIILRVPDEDGLSARVTCTASNWVRKGTYFRFASHKNGSVTPLGKRTVGPNQGFYDWWKQRSDISSRLEELG